MGYAGSNSIMASFQGSFAMLSMKKINLIAPNVVRTYIFTHYEKENQHHVHI